MNESIKQYIDVLHHQGRSCLACASEVSQELSDALAVMTYLRGKWPGLAIHVPQPTLGLGVGLLCGHDFSSTSASLCPA